MKFAINYSRPAASLLRSGQLQIDLFKCPAWPDLLAESQALCETYVHFPLRVGSGQGDALDAERRQPADWRAVEALLKQARTSLVNLHLAPGPREYPDLPVDSTSPAHVERVTQNLLRDVRAVVARFGPEHVVVENCHPSIGTILNAACLPEVIARVVEESGCGLLFDLSHARLAACALDRDAREYIAALPVNRFRELHVTGIQRIDGYWAGIVRAAAGGEAMIEPYLGRLMDHLPLTAADWEFLRWAMAQVRRGAWSAPWVVTLEYGGVGGPWEAVTDVDVLRSQVPLVYNTVHANDHDLGPAPL